MAEPGIAGTRACPLCGRTRKILRYARAPHEVVECPDCGMVFLSAEMSYTKQVAEHDFLDSYQVERDRRQATHPILAFISSWTRRLKPEIGLRLLAQTLRWRPAAQGGRLVDFGCGDGKFLAEAARYFLVSGVEISSRLAAGARERVPGVKIHVGPVTEAQLDEAAFDVVTQFSVLEHEWHPRAALAAAQRALAPGGITVIKVPNYASWNRRVMGLDWCGFRLPDHCNYFTPATLAKMLRGTGFQPLPGSPLDRLPTSDSLWMAAQK